jgi:penicillin-binding protein 2
MTRKLRKLFSRKAKFDEIDPDEIFLDSHNIPQFNTDQFEGRIEKPISRMALFGTLAFFGLILCAYLSRAWFLQVAHGADYTEKSENNRLRSTPIFAARGVIYDRNGVELAWNEPGSDPDISIRKYAEIPGLAHVLGYVQYPTKDSSGFYYREDFEGMDGVEKYFNDQLQGTNGSKLIEVDAHGAVQSENGIEPPKEGQNITLSIDSRVQSEMNTAIKHIAESVGFRAGAGVMMDIHTGEVIAMTSYPEFSSQVMSDKKKEDSNLITKYLTDKTTPFLDRVIDGLYTPGSIVKPYVALGALNEGIITPDTTILGTAYISIKNQFDPTQETLFRDWKAQGIEDVRKAIAVSSDVFFYEVGGGYKDQKGLGITKMDHYFGLFGFGQTIPDSFFTGAAGQVPSPENKAKQFNGETWRLGDTYHTAIGQYTYQVTPIQIVRGIASVANGGTLLNPTIVKDGQGSVARQVDIPAADFEVIREGMRKGALEGTGVSLNVPYVHMATKSGTAELGATKANVNSWMTGFFPYENPKYAFAVVMESGSKTNLVGAGAAMRETIDWMSKNTPEYFKQ